MPSLKLKDIEKIYELTESDKNYFPIFVETGTHMGETINEMSKHFYECHTVELSEKYFDIFQNSNYNKNKIYSYLGDSSEILVDICSKLKKNSTFFLDGHWSNGDTAKGPKDCPLIEEIKVINEFFEFETIIIIDDFRLFGLKLSEDWSDITKEKLLSIVDERIILQIVYDDRLILKLNKKNKT